MTTDRRADAHRKIKLGGLIVKAELGDEDAAVLLGALLTIRQMLRDPSRRATMLAIGSKAFATPEI